MKCAYCWRQARPNEKYCTKCGGRLQAAGFAPCKAQATKPAVNARHLQIDQQWNAAIPYGWGNAKTFGKDRQERGDRGMHRGERVMLYCLLEENENIKALVGGQYRAEQDTVRTSKHLGVAVATDRRVLFLDKGVFGSTEVSEMPYRSIEGLTYSTGMMFGGVMVTGLGRAGWRIENVKPKESAQLFADAVRGLVEDYHAAHAGNVGPQVSSADELEKWAGLLRCGTISQSEFDVKKKQLLGI